MRGLDWFIESLGIGVLGEVGRGLLGVQKICFGYSYERGGNWMRFGVLYALSLDRTVVGVMLGYSGHGTDDGG